VASALARVDDVGQSVAVSERACVAVEAMEGTDAMLRRAAALALTAARCAWSKSRTAASICSLTCPSPARPPFRTMIECGATALAIDAGRTLLLDQRRNVAGSPLRAGIAVVGCQPEES
jgi:DUF1009 family protein